MKKSAAGSLRDCLREAVRDCITLNERLEAVIHLPQQHLSGDIRHGKVSAAPIPWFSAGAYLITDLHAESREMEARLRMTAGQPVRDRGGSGGNTYKALEAVLGLAWAVDDGRVLECTKWLERWCGRARIALGEADQPRRLPRQPGQRDPVCPYCGAQTLRYWALSGIIRCINPSCFLEDGGRAQARMEFSTIADDFVVVWSDNSVGVPI